MATQDWTILDGGTHTVSDIDDVVMRDLNSLRANFEGTAAPSSSVAGQLHFRSTVGAKALYLNPAGDSNWVKLCDATTYGGLLPLSAGSSYPLTNDLYLGGKKIINVGEPTAAQHAATRNYVDTEIDGHTHDGYEGAQIPYTYISTQSATANTVLFIKSGGGIRNKFRAVTTDSDGPTLYSYYTEMAAASLWVWADEIKTIRFSMEYDKLDDLYWKILRNGVEIYELTPAERWSSGYRISWTIQDPSPPSTSASYTYSLQAHHSSGSGIYATGSIVLEVF